MKKLFFIGALGVCTLASCNSTHPAHNEEEAHEHESQEHSTETTHSSDEIILPAEKAKAAGVSTAIVTPKTFREVINASGEIMAAQGDESVVVATVAGVVSFQGKVTEGISVNKGQTLAVVSSGNIAEGDPAQRAFVAYETARKEYERKKKLHATRIVSDKELAQAEETYQNARISYEALAENHSPAGQRITSPISGYVKSILVKEGDYVTIGQPLVSITQNQRLFLRAEVSEKYYPALRHVTSANFQTPYDNQVYQLDSLGGRLLSIGKASGENSYYLPVTFEFDNRGNIVPGSCVEVSLLGTPQENVIAVPRTALTEEQGIYFAYIQLDEEGYRKQEVKVGADNGKEVQILSGLKQGDRVVTTGAYHVRLASASNAIPAHTHEH